MKLENEIFEVAMMLIIVFLMGLYIKTTITPGSQTRYPFRFILSDFVRGEIGKRKP